MQILNLTMQQARDFLLLKQGLQGNYRFRGKQGICDFIRQAGCIQYDPIDVCGKNAQLVLQSRVAGFKKSMLSALLYEDRRLIDYYDKNMSIFCVEDWKYFERIREQYRREGRSRDKVAAVAEEIRRTIGERKFACSQDLKLTETVDWAWNPTSLSRAALETLYFRGELIIHHKKGTVKYYALSEEFIDPALLTAEDPNRTREQYLAWRVTRRIGSVGLLWNKPSDAWLGIEGFKREQRNRAFADLINQGKIAACSVEGVPEPLYYLREDAPLLQEVLSGRSFKKRVEFIAPLDNLLWDRRLIRVLFSFDYKWEIYTPVTQRKYGYYVLPVLYGNRFVGRIEFAVDKRANVLTVRRFWKEDDVKPDRAFASKFQKSLQRFAAFNGCTQVAFQAADV